MKHSLSLSALMLIMSHTAAAAIDPTAAVVELRKSCTENGTTLDNCFETTTSLTDWINTTRIPDANAPLRVDIGPGSFEYFQLDNAIPSCHISLIGSGRQHTRINTSEILAPAAMQFPAHCMLSVSNLTIENDAAVWAINVTGGGAGVTTWSDVDILGTTYGWQGGGACNSKHFWFNSRIITTPGGLSNDIARAYTTCAEDWFYGSEITAHARTGDPTPDEMFAITAQDNAEVHVYGSIIRLITEAGINMVPGDLNRNGAANIIVTGPLAVASADGADVHIHGSAIDVLSEEGNETVTLAVLDGGHIHANETSYNLSTGSGGTVTRILNKNGMVRAPAVWEASGTLPAIVSSFGQDTGVYTGAADGRPHIVVYDASCANDWFDTTANQCL